MTPQEYRKERQREALGGCGLFLILFFVWPVTWVLTGSFILGALAASGATCALVYGLR